MTETTVTLQPGDRHTVITPGTTITVDVAQPTPIPPPQPVQPPPVQPPATASLPPIPLADFSRFLVERVLDDGSPALVAGAGRKRTVYDTLTWARSDYGRPGGYERYVAAEDSLRGRWVGAWSFYPWTGFNPALGDGGQTIQENGNILIISETQDGGRPDIQQFTGVQPGGLSPKGTGWLICDDMPPSGSWRYYVARLNINGALPLNPAWTRWRMEMLTIPFMVNGSRLDIVRPALITEHFNGATVADAVSLEQSIFLDGFGEVWWAAYGTGAPIGDFAGRTPFGLPWSGPPERPDFVLEDARLWTQIEPIGPGESSVVQWPP